MSRCPHCGFVYGRPYYLVDSCPRCKKPVHTGRDFHHPVKKPLTTAEAYRKLQSEVE